MRVEIDKCTCSKWETCIYSGWFWFTSNDASPMCEYAVKTGKFRECETGEKCNKYKAR